MYYFDYKDSIFHGVFSYNDEIIPRERVCCFSIVRQPQRTKIGITLRHWCLLERTSLFAVVWLILVLATNSKRVKVLYCLKMAKMEILLRIPE